MVNEILARFKRIDELLKNAEEAEKEMNRKRHRKKKGNTRSDTARNWPG